MAFSSKHLLNDPKDLVIDSLRGLCRINPNLALDESDKGFPQTLQFSISMTDCLIQWSFARPEMNRTWRSSLGVDLATSQLTLVCQAFH